MDETDELVNVLSSTVNELKNGIMQYSQTVNQLPFEKQAETQELIKEMHQVALRLNQGVEGLQRLKVLKSKLMG